MQLNLSVPRLTNRARSGAAPEKADLEEVLSQTNAYLLAYVHMHGEEVAGEGNRQPHYSQSQSSSQHYHAVKLGAQPQICLPKSITAFTPKMLSLWMAAATAI
ncbi:TPA: hypothetical protein ACH3X1_013815 [Trebouxia sp. C0004]